MKTYEKTGTKYIRKYGISLKDFCKRYKISQPTVSKWETSGFDIFERAKNFISTRTLNSNKRLHSAWNGMKSRCGNPNASNYSEYGGKGIKIKMEKKDLAYLWNRDRAYLMKCPSIDRIDSNGHYELSNCRFLELVENGRRGGLSKKHHKATPNGGRPNSSRGKNGRFKKESVSSK